MSILYGGLNSFNIQWHARLTGRHFPSAGAKSSTNLAPKVTLRLMAIPSGYDAVHALLADISDPREIMLLLS
jgi:hypothetical protein